MYMVCGSTARVVVCEAKGCLGKNQAVDDGERKLCACFTE